MANCEETPCVNVQSAICLHCLQRLCSKHILEHGTVLLREGDELCEQINELAEQLNASLQQIHSSRQEAVDKLNLWRQKQIDNLDHKYAETMQIIEFRKDHITEIENELTERLIKEAKTPLEDMQARQSASAQSLETIRQVISNVIKDSTQIEVYSKDSTVSSPVVNTNKSHLLQSDPSQQQSASIKPMYYINASDLELLAKYKPSVTQKQTTTSDPIPNEIITTIPPSTSSSTSKPPIESTVALPTVPPPQPTVSATSKPITKSIPAAAAALPTVPPLQSTTKPTVTAVPTVTPPQPTASATSKPITKSTAVAAALPTVSSQQSTASASSKKVTRRPPTSRCKKLVEWFKDVSGSSDNAIQSYIVKYLKEVVHVNNWMIVLLSLLEAWHPQLSPPIINHRVLFQHVNNIKKYIKGQEHQLTVIAAIQVFLNSCGHDEKKSTELMTNLLQYFSNQQCLTKEIIFDWYQNGASYGYPGFRNAKLWSKSFVDQLNTDN